MLRRYVALSPLCLVGKVSVIFIELGADYVWQPDTHLVPESKIRDSGVVNWWGTIS